MTIKKFYEHHCNQISDINEHLPTLKNYTEMCDTVIEMGVRTVVSTWAFLSGKPKKLTSIDIVDPSRYGVDMNSVKKMAEEQGIEFNFLLEDTTKIEIEECDMLFIDTWHVYPQLKTELAIHGNKAKKFLVFHDTETFGTFGEGWDKGKPDLGGLQPAIDEFLEDNSHWSVKEVFTNNNGLTILERDESSVH